MTLQLASAITGVGVRTDIKRAYVAAEGTSTVRILGLSSSPPQFLAGPLVMPLEPKLLVTAPNGFAIYAFAEDAVFEIDPFANTIGAGDQHRPAGARRRRIRSGRPSRHGVLTATTIDCALRHAERRDRQVLFHGEQCRQSGVARTRPDLCLDRIQRRPFQDRYQRVDSVSGR